MEENALLSNISSILAKDLLVDNNKTLLKPKHFLHSHDDTYGNPNDAGKQTSLNDDSDDEMTEFFLKQLERKVNNYKRNLQEEKKIKRQQQIFNECKRVKKQEDEKKEFKSAEMSKKRIKIESKPIELNLLNKFDSIQFEGHLHLAKMTFLKLFQTLRSLLTSETDVINITPQSVFSLSLWKLTTDEHFEEITRKFGVHLTDCQRIIRHFWNLIGSNYKLFVKWPKSQIRQQANMKGFQANSNCKILPGLFGIVVLKRLDIFMETEDEETSVVLQIVCDSDQNVIDCYVELARNYNFFESPIGKALSTDSFSLLPTNSYLIADTNLPLKPFLICPFTEPKTESEKLFNKHMDRVLGFGLQVLDAMAKRFNILYALEARDLAEVRKILLTVCVLHNLCVDAEDDYIDRKREIIKFNWATASYNNIISGRVINDDNAEKSRDNLIKRIVN